MNYRCAASPRAPLPPAPPRRLPSLPSLPRLPRRRPRRTSSRRCDPFRLLHSDLGLATLHFAE